MTEQTEQSFWMNKRMQVIVATKRYEWKKTLENKHCWVNLSQFSICTN